ncbi:MAG: ATP-dependent DNA helicase RecG [Bacteroidetes bacterium]|nr:ATP-dependent DNA helicase RecG [Bacteroidota bacterium]
MPTLTDKLHTSLVYLKGVGPAKAELLSGELGLFRYSDLLTFMPFRYVDRTQIQQVRDLREDMQTVQLRGRIKGFSMVGPPRSRRLVAQLEDDTGSVELIWFKGASYMERYLKRDATYTVFGKPNVYRGKFTLPHPDMELGEGPAHDARRMQPVYPSTEKLKARGLDSKGLERLVQQLLAELSPADLPEILPGEMRVQFKLIGRERALRDIHFPPDEHALQGARRRLKFEEFLLIQLGLLLNKSALDRQVRGYIFERIDGVFEKFYRDHLGFELTEAQKRVLREIRKDTRTGMQMNRLLQGDVGSGKTIVALMAMLMAVDNGFQAAIMAPTEILAQQHMLSITELVDGLPVLPGLLTGSVKGKSRKDLLSALEAGYVNLLIGTHALIEDKVVFNNLGLVVIDEQHRFGVAQRARLWAKNTQPPHVLVMTATPIPRTLAMTLYGDLDTSVIDELPPGRKPIQTVHRKDPERLAVFGFLRKQLQEGRQVYVVYPLIEESETMDYKDLMDGYESVVRAFPEYRISIVHGRQKPADKDHEMREFVRGNTRIMVATTVIEVGVNVPNASVMVVESAERFGLAQLHQLRGRVGRGADQSFCILMTADKLSNDARVRIRTMCETTDGFKISEVDMRLRGPGDLAGTRQSGLEDLKIADLVHDREILEEARSAALALVEKDPQLRLSVHAALANHLVREERLKGDWSRIS